MEGSELGEYDIDSEVIVFCRRREAGQDEEESEEEQAATARTSLKVSTAPEVCKIVSLSTWITLCMDHPPLLPCRIVNMVNGP